MPPVDMCIFDLGEAWPRAADIGSHLDFFDDMNLFLSPVLIQMLVNYFGLESYFIIWPVQLHQLRHDYIIHNELTIHHPGFCGDPS